MAGAVPPVVAYRQAQKYVVADEDASRDRLEPIASSSSLKASPTTSTHRFSILDIKVSQVIISLINYLFFRSIDCGIDCHGCVRVRIHTRLRSDQDPHIQDLV